MANKAKYVTMIPAEAGKPVSMCVFRDQIVLACEYGVWIYRQTGEWEQILAIARPK